MKLFPVILIILFLTSCSIAPWRQANIETAKSYVLTKIPEAENLNIIEEETLRCDKCSVVVLSFSQDETDHIISVVVQDGEVTQAVLDNKVDELVGNDRLKFFFCNDRANTCNNESNIVCSSNQKNFLNGCYACADTDIKWFTEGKCSLGYNQRVLDDINKGKISKESGPVLILVGWNV